MGNARGPQVVRKALWLGVSQRVDFAIFEDEALKKPKDVSGSTVVLRVKDSAALVKDYSTTATNLTLGKGYATVVGSSHTIGDATAWVIIDSIPIQEYTLEFKSAL